LITRTVASLGYSRIYPPEYFRVFRVFRGQYFDPDLSRQFPRVSWADFNSPDSHRISRIKAQMKYGSDRCLVLSAKINVIHGRIFSQAECLAKEMNGTTEQLPIQH
jgi:hypothetical protein